MAAAQPHRAFVAVARQQSYVFLVSYAEQVTDIVDSSLLLTEMAMATLDVSVFPPCDFWVVSEMMVNMDVAQLLAAIAAVACPGTPTLTHAGGCGHDGHWRCLHRVHPR